jgi:glycosyltransferase involved in cell wall biosynthesis
LIDDSTGYLYDNLEQCTETIRKIIDDRTDALEKSINARQRVIQKYDMSRLNKEYIEILETIGE